MVRSMNGRNGSQGGGILRLQREEWECANDLRVDVHPPIRCRRRSLALPTGPIDRNEAPFYPPLMDKRILVLGNSTDRSAYRPVEEWSRTFGDVPFDAVHVPSGEPIPPLDRYTHLMITGSEATFSRPEPWFDVEADVVRNAVHCGLAVFGSCFGHQLLAYALSGPEAVRRALIPEVGWVAIEIVESDPLFAEMPNPWHAFSAHLDEACNLPEPWRILARNDACPVQAMRYGDRPVWGIQPHPETSPDEAKLQMEAGIEQYPHFAEAIRQALASPVRDDRTAPQLMSTFLRHERGDARAPVKRPHAG